MARSDAANRHSIEDGFSAGAAAGAGELQQARRRFAVEEYMDAPLVVRKKAMPALVIRAVREQVLSDVATAAIPALDYQALIEVESDPAGRGPRSAGGRDRLPAQPEIQRPVVAV